MSAVPGLIEALAHSKLRYRTPTNPLRLSNNKS
jgi:hypothetical protein